MQTTITISATTILTIVETEEGATASLRWHGTEVWSKTYEDHDLQEAAWFATEDTSDEIAALRKADARIKRFRTDLGKAAAGATSYYDLQRDAYAMRERRDYSLRQMFQGVWGSWAAESMAYDLFTAEIAPALAAFETARDAKRKAEIAAIRADYDARIAHLAPCEISYMRELGTLGPRP